MNTIIISIYNSRLWLLFTAIVWVFISYCIAGSNIIHDLRVISILPMIVALLAGGGLVFVNTQITTLIKKREVFRYSPKGNMIARARQKMIMQKGRIWVVRILCLCLLEEVIFRYLVITQLMAWSFSPISAGLISSLFFAVMHLNIRKMLEYTLIGIVFAAIFIATDNIIYSTVAHFTNNFIIYVIKCRIMSRELSGDLNYQNHQGTQSELN